MERKKRVKPRSCGTTRWLLAVLAAAVIGYLAYSVVIFEKAGVDEAGGVFACEGQKCVLALPDVHAEVVVTLCGEQRDLPLEAGALEGQHTHKQRNVIHSPHISVPADPTTRQPLTPVTNTVGGLFDNIGWTVTEECVQGTCNGVPCGAKAGTWTLSKNGVRQPTIRDTVWSDDDTLALVFE